MRVLLVLALAVLALWTLTCITQVQPGERAVVRRFGRVQDYKLEPGLHFHMPWGIDQVNRVPIKLERNVRVGYDAEAEETFAQTPAGQLLTGDHNLINVQVVVDYTTIEDEVADYVINADRAEGLIARATETALAEWVAGRNVEVVLLDGKRLLPIWITRRAQELLGEYHLGVRIKSASVTHLYPPSDVKSAFDDVTRAQSKILTLKYEAEQESDRKRREELARKFQLESETQAYRQQQILQAKADAETFERRLDQFNRLRKQNPNYVTTLWMDEISRLFARMREGGRIDLLDNRLGADGLDILQIPLTKKK